MRILVDADGLIYRAAFAVEYPEYTVVWGDDLAKQFQYKKDAKAYIEENELEDAEILTRTIVEEEKNAKYVIDSLINGIAFAFKVDPSELELVLSDPKNCFRKDVAFTKPYKGNRKPKPVHYQALRDYLTSSYVIHITQNEEADDYLGYTQWHTYHHEGPDESCIVTIDKDLDMIPGLHYNYVKEQEYYVTEEEADNFFLTQLLTGDSTDNIPGVPGVGEKRAATLLKDLSVPEAFGAILNAYLDAYGKDGKAIMDEQAQLLWIRRKPDDYWNDYWRELCQKAV